jgi:hypothetical protein
MPLLRPEEQVFSAMLDGWRNQQLARNLAFSTVEGRERVVRAFAAHADAFPWQWTPLLVGEWCTDLRAVQGLRRSALRQYQESVRMLCDYLTDPEYGWAEQCIARFGTHPVQVCHEWNTAVGWLRDFPEAGAEFARWVPVCGSGPCLLGHLRAAIVRKPSW